MARTRILRALGPMVGLVMVLGILAGCGSTPKATPTPSLPSAGQTGETRTINGIEMVFVPAGEFTMGGTEEVVSLAIKDCKGQYCPDLSFRSELPAHTVTVDGFWIGKYEVTNAQYRRFIEAGGYKNQKYWSDEGWQQIQGTQRTKPSYWEEKRWNGDNYPVVGVWYYEAEAFARWAGMRLPTEAEWEKAARGTDGRLWPWGSDWDNSRANTLESISNTKPVGSCPTGASPYGVLDMAGNAWEWCSDWYAPDYYKASPTTNPTGPSSGTVRAMRGGSFFISKEAARCSVRSNSRPDYTFFSANQVGFRVVAPVAPGP